MKNSDLPLTQTMKQYLSEQTINDYIKINNTIQEDKYALLKTKATDTISLILIAGAKNQEQFNDIVQWGEDNEIASTATFSRRKNYLKKLGIIEEENIKTPMGRPKILLKINEKSWRTTIHKNNINMGR